MALKSVPALLLLVGLPLTASAQDRPAPLQPPLAGADLLLFGGPAGDEFLGCLTCGRYDPDSVFNPYGEHGSKYGSGSIWNRYGRNGSEYSPSSPWNKWASSPPEVYDRSGTSYGAFTSDESRPGRVWLPSLQPLMRSGGCTGAGSGAPHCN